MALPLRDMRAFEASRDQVSVRPLNVLTGSQAAPVLAHLAVNCTAPLASALARRLAANQ